MPLRGESTRYWDLPLPQCRAARAAGRALRILGDGCAAGRRRYLNPGRRLRSRCSRACSGRSSRRGPRARPSNRQGNAPPSIWVVADSQLGLLLEAAASGHVSRPRRGSGRRRIHPRGLRPSDGRLQHPRGTRSRQRGRRAGNRRLSGATGLLPDTPVALQAELDGSRQPAPRRGHALEEHRLRLLRARPRRRTRRRAAAARWQGPGGSREAGGADCCSLGRSSSQ